MPFRVAQAADLWAQEIAGCAQHPPAGWPEGIPSRDLTRSPAAARIGRLAASQGLRLFHYEHRHHLPLPQDFVPEHAPELSEPPRFEAGVLPERKYQSFRHDQAIGGFHPGMRAKWSAHELCHALVGFAWRPGASPLFLATAGRLAELLPVVLWYFLDEAHLRRCPLHRTTGPLFRGLCLDCETVAEPRVDEVHAAAFLESGRLYLERELLAIRRTEQLGLPVPHIHGSLDLCSDGLAYAAAHGPRLNSQAFHRYAAGFLVEGGGWVQSLEALEARVLAVLDALVKDGELTSLAPSRSHGECRWVLQDLGWRLLEIWQECEGEAAEELARLIDQLATACRSTADGALSASQVREVAQGATGAALSGYRALEQDYVLPPPDQVFALGHDLLGLDPGRSSQQVREGVTTALPITTTLLGEHLPPLVESFLGAERPVRAAVGRRFATWLLGRASEPLCDLARFEAAASHLPARDSLLDTLGPVADAPAYRLTPGVVVLRASVDPLALASAADFGDIELHDGLSLLDVDGAPIPQERTTVALIRGLDGSVEVSTLDPELGEAVLSLGEGAALDLPLEQVVALVERGLIRPVRYPT